MKDLRGDLIRLFEHEGWRYYGEICIDKDPQAQAIRTKSKGLLFTQVHKDSSWSRPALADYIVLFRKGHQGEVPVVPDITNNEWIEWARPIWYGIRESETLQYRGARSEDDSRHICPLQLGTVERCIRLWTNKGETVLDPFAGIGTVPYQAIKLGRKALGVELKPEYWAEARKNLDRAVDAVTVPDLFTAIGGLQ
jgi:DNA modification methylase